MRVSELANELGKTSKEVLDIIKQKDSSASLFAASSVSKDQEIMVRNAVSQKKEGAPKAEAEKAEPAKKKLTAVFRPQNAKQQIKRPVPKEQPKPQQAAPKAEETKPVQAAEAKTQVQETSAPAVENRPAQTERGDFQNRSQNGYQGRDNRGERPQGGYQNRDGRTGGYQGRDNRGDRPQGGYQNRDGRTGGYQGRDNRGERPQGGYQNRDGRTGGYQGRDNRGDRPQGGFQNRGDRPQGGFQNRGDRPQGGFQNRGDRPQGGFQNRGDRPQGGFQNRGDRPQGGFQNRDRNQGGFGSVSEKIRTEIIQTEMAAETAAVLLAAEITVHLLLTARSRQSQAAPARQTRTLIRMTVLTRETEKKTERRKHQRQERELSSCHSLRKKRLRLRMLRPLPFQSA